MSFQAFQEAFNEKYTDIHDFIWESEGNLEEKPLPFGLKEVQNLDNIMYDSYGSEDSELERIFFSEEFNIFVKFTGKRESYSGEEWRDYKEVREVEKTIKVWEDATK